MNGSPQSPIEDSSSPRSPERAGAENSRKKRPYSGPVMSVLGHLGNSTLGLSPGVGDSNMPMVRRP